MSKLVYKETAFTVFNGSEHPLSGLAVLELLRATIEKGKSFRFRALGFSMSPFIKDGDILTIAPIENRIRLGEVVAFIHPTTNCLVVHRIIDFQEEYYRSQGDNLPGRSDGLLLREAIFGKVVKIERGRLSIRFGLGPERLLIALFSRRGWLPSIIKKIAPAWSMLNGRSAG